MPFVAGKVGGTLKVIDWKLLLLTGCNPPSLFQSTSPSHSVHANIQSILHMMKHHQPWLCDQIRARHGPLRGIRKNLDKEFSPDVPNKPPREQNWPRTDEPLGSLSDLLLALQDELGQMSLCVGVLRLLSSCFQTFCDFYFNLQRASGIGGTAGCSPTPWREGRLEAGAGEFGHQDGRKGSSDHKAPQTLAEGMSGWTLKSFSSGICFYIWLHEAMQQVSIVFSAQVQDLTQGRRGHEGPPVPSPVKLKGKTSGPTENNRQLLRETYKFRNNLKQDDIHWETWASLQDHVSFDTTAALTTGCSFVRPSLFKRWKKAVYCLSDEHVFWHCDFL